MAVEQLPLGRAGAGREQRWGRVWVASIRLLGTAA